MKKGRRPVILALAVAWPLGFFLSSLRVFLEFGEWPYFSWHIMTLGGTVIWLPAGFAMYVDAIVGYVSEADGFELIRDYRLLVPYLIAYWIVLLLLHVQAIRKSNWRFAVPAICIVLLSAYNWHYLVSQQ